MKIEYVGGEPILAFRDEYEFLSNFYHSPLVYGGREWQQVYEWRTVEHAYQWAKNPTDDNARFFNKLPTPGIAKREGRRHFVRPDWEDVKVEVMRDLLYAKFVNEELKQQLLATGDRWLEEGNGWGDTFWGVSPVGSNNGQNMLGKLLMQVRATLR
jgi:ribA/ribD-fused uncharacterized protein